VRPQRAGLSGPAALRLSTSADRTIAAEQIARSPAWLPLGSAAGDAVRLVHLDESAYRSASFLDQRLLTLGYRQGECSVPVLEAAAARLSSRAHWIFHTGHVGSTLISRLVGAHAGFFSLREPALLRAVCVQAPSPPRTAALAVALALLGRTWRAPQRAVVKATSFVSELAEPILAGTDRPAAIFMFAQPHAYLQTIFAGPVSRVENRQLAAARLERLAQRLGAGEWRPDLHSEGECIAMSWLCEMTVLHQAATRCEDRVVWTDFDDFLAAPAAALAGVFRGLGVDPPAPEIEAIIAGPLMQQYSKAPEHPYDAELRRSLLLAADHEHAVQIRRGLAWLHRIAAHYPAVAAVLERSARERGTS
jgi:hypothetical protein